MRYGVAKSPTYKCWDNMIQRCTNVNNPAYKNYGGRGIEVCEDWRDFSNFYRDMGDVPSGLSLDRADNNLGYSADNCKWSDRREQNSNRRNPTAPNKGNTSGIKGIGWHKQLGKWRVRRGNKYLGVANTLEEAVSLLIRN